MSVLVIMNVSDQKWRGQRYGLVKGSYDVYIYARLCDGFVRHCGVHKFVLSGFRDSDGWPTCVTSYLVYAISGIIFWDQVPSVL